MSGRADIRRVQREGEQFRTKHFAVRFCPSPLPHARVGLIVPRFRESAVDRNRVKRRMREAIRVELLPGAPPVDLLIRAAKSAYGLTFSGVRDEVVRLAGLVRGGITGSACEPY